MPQASATSHPRRVPYVALLAILLLAFAVIVHRLDRVPLWADEGWTIAATAGSDPVETVADWVVVDVHPPLFFIGLSGWQLVAGDTIFELRYYAVLITLLGVCIAYRLGRAMYGTRAGLLAALFYGLHDLVKVLTQEVRHYPQQMALSALAMYTYWRFWRRPTRMRGIVFALSGAALIYTHYWGGFVLLGLAVHALITRRHALRPFVYAFGGIGLLYVPWLPALVHQITLERPGGLPHALENSRRVYAVLTYQLIGIPELFWVVLAAAGALGTFTLTAASTRALIAKWTPTAATLLPLLVVVLTPLLSILLNTAYPTLSFRSLAVIVPAIMLLAAHGLARFRQPEQFVIVSFAVLYSLSLTGAGPVDRAPWPQLAEYVALHSTSDDAVLLEVDTDEFAVAYYLTQFGTDAALVHSETERELESETYAGFLDAELADRDGVWVAKLGWEALADVRPDLVARGFVQTAPTLTYDPAGFRAVPPGGTPFIYIDRPIQLWRMDRIPAGDPVVTFSEGESGDVLRLMRAGAATVGDTVVINLLWQPGQSPTRDYTVSAFVRGQDVFVNDDSAPLDGLSPTVGWAADGLYFDSHAIDVSALAAGPYDYGVQVYYFTSSDFSSFENLTASDCDDDPNCRFVILGTVAVAD